MFLVHHMLSFFQFFYNPLGNLIKHPERVMALSLGVWLEKKP
jgi:hypothetical protein